MIYRNNDLDKAGEFFSSHGDETEPIYSPKIVADGRIELEVTGKRDIQQEIDSWREHTDMSYILRQMAAGQYEPKYIGSYGDFTNMPETMAEAMQLMLDAENAFHELPIETQNKFDNNYRKWLMMANQETQKFSELMGFVSNEDVQIEDEVKIDVQEQ